MANTKVDLAGKTALVTGSNRGIGKAITIELLEKGVKQVYAAARNVDKLKELEDTYGDRLIPVALDVTDAGSIKAAAEQISELDILVNNAGVLSYGKVFAEDASDTLQQNFDVNVTGLVNVTNALSEHMKKDKETAIVNFSSMAGLGNMPSLGTYSVSKAAVHSITQGMRAELKENNTLVMGVYPGPIETAMTAGFEMEMDSPQNVARNVVEGIVNGTEDMFPDAMSSQVGPMYGTNPKGVEQEFGKYV